jgi:hypothetical protein
MGIDEVKKDMIAHPTGIPFGLKLFLMNFIIT